MSDADAVAWLLSEGQPWVRFRTLVDLLDRPKDDRDTVSARAEMLVHPQVRALIEQAATWGGRAFKRHNDASYPIYAMSTLADFGLRAGDPGMRAGINAVLAHQSPEGAFQTLTNFPVRFGGTGEDMWSWVLCDAPTLLYILLAMGLGSEQRVRRAVDHLVGAVHENGWRCLAAPELGRFRGPGRRDDPCPIVNVYALKALSLVPDQLDSPAARAGVEMLLRHWEHQSERKLYLFGIGTDFRKIKYPFVWYNVLHVVDVLTRFPFARADPRLGEMVKVIADQADENERYTATSMYRAWKGWSFANKKSPSPWLTFLAQRLQKRMEEISTRE